MRIPSIVSPAPDTIVIATVQPELFIILYTSPSVYELMAYSSSPLVTLPYANGSMTWSIGYCDLSLVPPVT